MTVSSLSSSIVVFGNNATSSFNFPFIGVAAADISVTYTSTSGTQTVLSPSQFNLTLNSPNPNQLWGVGGQVQYPISGPPIPVGSSITISRILPLTQQTSIQNQGNYYAQVTEQALDMLCMEIQQVAARGGQFRGTWASGVAYSFGDIVQDGANGANTLNFYICTNANTSGTWAADLAAGYWSIAFNVQAISGSITAKAAGTSGEIQYNNGGLLGGFTQSGDVTVNTASGAATIAANAVTNTKLAQVPGNTIKGNNTGSTANAADLTAAQVIAMLGLTITTAWPTAISGLIPSSISGSNTSASISVSAGYCTDSTNAVIITGAGYSWAASNGAHINGTDASSSTLADSTTYHMYLCTGISGTGTYCSATYPGSGVTFPTGYTSNYRRIFSFNTTSAGAPVPYTAIETEGGALIAWLATQLLDISTTGLTNSGRTLFTLTIPSGIKMQVFYRIDCTTGSNDTTLLTSGDEADVGSGAIGFTSAPGNDGISESGQINAPARDGLITSNTSGQIGARAANSSANLYWVTRGFKDFRRA